MKNLIKSVVIVLLISVLIGVVPVSAKQTQAATVKGFSDVMDSKVFWFKPVYWASEKGITTGYKDGAFKPGKDCTRAQMVTFLWRMNGSPVPRNKSCGFKDVKKSSYYYKPVLWAVENGITTGYSKTRFKPDNVCTRAQTVTFLWRMAGKPIPKSTKSKFTDVKKSAYYYNAVLWASEKGIVAGYKDGTFKPDEKCLRRQIVTFLWKYSGKPEPKNLPDIKVIKVSNAYSKTKIFDNFNKVKCSVPKISISNVDTSQINAALYSYAKNAVDKFDAASVNAWNIKYAGYECYYTQDYISIHQWIKSEIMDVGMGATVKDYIISTSTGKQLSRSEALKKLGTDQAQFNKSMEKKVKAIEQTLEKDLCVTFSSDIKAYNKAQAKKATPYIDSKGNLCYTVRIQYPAGSGATLVMGRLNSSKYTVWGTGSE